MRNDVDPGRNVFREGKLQSKACEYARYGNFDDIIVQVA